MADEHPSFFEFYDEDDGEEPFVGGLGEAEEPETGEMPEEDGAGGMPDAKGGDGDDGEPQPETGREEPPRERRAPAALALAALAAAATITVGVAITAIGALGPAPDGEGPDPEVVGLPDAGQVTGLDARIRVGAQAAPPSGPRRHDRGRASRRGVKPEPGKRPVARTAPRERPGHSAPGQPSADPGAPEAPPAGAHEPPPPTAVSPPPSHPTSAASARPASPADVHREFGP